jgi:hypothetical protein
MRKDVWRETMRLLKEIDNSVKDILREAEEELKMMSPHQKLELFGTTEDPILLDDCDWNDLFPIGIDEIEEDKEIEEDEVEDEEF